MFLACVTSFASRQYRADFTYEPQLATMSPISTERLANCILDRLAKIDLWNLARVKGDSDETCEILSCDQVARAVVVISYADGRASIRNYCSDHESKSVDKLKRNNVGVELVDHRGPVGDRLRLTPIATVSAPRLQSDSTPTLQFLKISADGARRPRRPAKPNSEYLGPIGHRRNP
jgi:hypothetical protein